MVGWSGGRVCCVNGRSGKETRGVRDEAEAQLKPFSRLIRCLTTVVL